MLISEVVIEEETEDSITISKKSWHKIEKVLTKTQKNLKINDLKRFIGKIHLSEEPLEFQKRIRNEW
jgi:hypothetical protein